MDLQFEKADRGSIGCYLNKYHHIVHFSEAIYCEPETVEGISWQRTQAGYKDKKPCPDERKGLLFQVLKNINGKFPTSSNRQIKFNYTIHN